MLPEVVIRLGRFLYSRDEVTRINDVVYRIRRGLKRKTKIVHLGHLMKYDSDTIDVSDRDDQN